MIFVVCTVICIIALSLAQEAILRANNNGPWGDWYPKEYCPDGQFARGIGLYVLPESSDIEDDWAAMLIGLLCSANACDMNPERAYSMEGMREWWREVVCPCPGYIISFRQKVEPHQGGGDDTALNSVQIRCSDGTVLEPSNGGPWGNWGDWSPTCPQGWYVSASALKREWPNSDNTGLNAVEMYCSETTPVDGWYMGAKGAICDQTCQAKGLRCDADKQSTINSPAAANNAFAAASYRCKATDPILNRAYAGTPFRVENGDCYHLTSGAKSVCNANALSHHWPLCYCTPDTELGWKMGAKGATCDQTCEARGLQCDADKQSTITSPAAAKNAFAAAGYQCKVTDPILHRAYAGTPFREGNVNCYHLSSGARSVCNANANPNHYPLCYCRGANDPNVPCDGFSVVDNNIYACRATFSGGVYGSEAANICPSGYEICKSADDASNLGLTADICQNPDIFKNRDEFFATKETSAGYGRCYSGNKQAYVEGQTQYANDIWGCSHPNPSLTLMSYTCKNGQGQTVFTKSFGGRDTGSWKYGGDGYQEAIKASLTSTHSGGVLCCKIFETGLEVDVLGNTHSAGGGFYFDAGMYFNFDKTQLDEILGRTNWNGQVFEVILTRTQERRKVRVWRSPTGSAGDAHGRKEPYSSKSGTDWQTGDVVIFDNTVPVSSALAISDLIDDDFESDPLADDKSYFGLSAWMMYLVAMIPFMLCAIINVVCCVKHCKSNGKYAKVHVSVVSDDENEDVNL